MEFLSKNLKIPQLISKYLNYLTFQESYSAHTIRAYKEDLRQAFTIKDKNYTVCPTETLTWSSDLELPVMDLDTLKSTLLRAPLLWSNLAHSTRNRKVATLKSFSKWLYMADLVPKDLGLELVSPRPQPRLPHYISVDEFFSVLKCMLRTQPENEFTHRQEILLFLLLYGGGLRVSEACNLQWENIELQQSKILVLGKGQKERWIPLPPIVSLELKRIERLGPFVFGEKPLSTRHAYDVVRLWGIRAGLTKPLHPHVLRHSYATHLLTSGASLRTLQELLGHTSLNATEKYTHLDLQQLARTVERFHPFGVKTSDDKE